MKNRLILVVLASLICVFLFVGLVFAANENALNKSIAKADNNKTVATRNMTYGQCVVAGVQLKNACYETTKQVRFTCMANAINGSQAKKQCSEDYKKDVKQCKADFKAAKKDCIQTTKPGKLAKLRYSLA